MPPDESLDFEPLDYGDDDYRYVPDGVVRIATRYGFVDVPDAFVRHEWRVNEGPPLDFLPNGLNHVDKIEVRPVLQASWQPWVHPWLQVD